MRIALRYVAAPVLAASVAVTIAGATASAMAEPQPAHTTDAPMANPHHGVVYCGQYCGDYSPYSNHGVEAAAPLSSRIGAPWRDPLAPISIRLPIIDAAGIPMPHPEAQH
jgi:hypothetical protein